MIKSFSVENYKAFPNKVKIDFSWNAYIKEKKEVLEIIWKEKIVRNAVIYWQNAVWKTLLLKAIQDLSNLVKYSFSEIKSTIQLFELQPYKWNKNKTISFEIEFFVWKQLYKFFLEIEEWNIKKEILYKKNKLLYNRENQKVKLYSKFVEEEKKLEKLLRQDSLLLSLLGALNDKKARKIINFFERIEFISALDTFSLIQNRLLKFSKESIEKYKKLLLQFLKFADFTIVDFKVKIEELKLQNLLDSFLETDNILLKFKSKRQKITFFHSKDNEIFELPYEEESSWTRQFFELLLFLIDSIEKEKILLVDEFDDNLHFEIAKQILKLVNLPFWRAQFIFTTHNLEFMDFSLLRKDQIFLINKKENDEKEIYSVDEFKDIRKTYNLKDIYKAWIIWGYPLVEDFTAIKDLLDEIKSK